MPPVNSLSDSEPSLPSPVSKEESALSVVGIGASAGGLSALKALFAEIPDDTGMVYVVIVHLSPDHESMLADLLQPQTRMPVTQVTQRVQMQPDHVYIIPPGKRLVARDGHLDLADFSEPRGQRMPIDLFFRTLAEEHGDGAAIILSGTGSDGAVGIKAIKEGGGLLLVQDPDEAEYDGMPRSAIATGLVDIVATAGQLARELSSIKGRHATASTFVDPDTPNYDDTNLLLRILAHVRLRTGHDLSRYKRATLLRRIGRRMQIAHIDTLGAYLARIHQDEGECEALFRDLLIGVTEFFREPPSFQALQETVIPQIFSHKRAGDTVRVWSAGCASGEEAYSLAILLIEQAAQVDHTPEIQIFATDLGEGFLTYAREGVYPESIAADVSEERLKRFFIKEGHHYRVRSEVRERVLFAPHNLLQDPPFSRLDLISCRNVLIYFQRELQEKLFDIFHYALLPNGYLFLGGAESIDGAADLFETVDKHHRIYRRGEENGALRRVPSLPLALSEGRYSASRIPFNPTPLLVAERHWQMLEAHAPPSLLVDAQGQLLHLSETVGRYLQPSAGGWTNDMARILRPELRTELSIALQQAFEQDAPIISHSVSVKLDGSLRYIHMIVHPRYDEERRREKRVALVFFLEGKAPDIAGVQPGDEESQGQADQLQAEVRHLQGQLQILRQEHDLSTEELRAANEELQSINEEYRSTLEELETSKEELQSMNEELRTINQELTSKMTEVSQAHSDLQNLFTSTDIATLFLDRSLRIRRYTTRANQLFNLTLADRGRPITDLRPKVDYDQLEEDAHHVLEDLAAVERTIYSHEGLCFLSRMRPYRTLDDKIDGVVITFVDITALQQMAEALQVAKEYAEAIVETISEPLVVLDANLYIQSVNAAFYQTFLARPAETVGQRIFDIGNGQWQIPPLRSLLEDVLVRDHYFESFLVEHDFAQIGRRVMLLSARRIDHVDLILLAIQDITELAHKQAQLAEMRQRLIQSQETERRAIARDLHDGPMQELSALTFELTSVSQGVTEEAQQAQIATIAAKIGRVIGHLRGVSTMLRPPAVVEFGLASAVGQQVRSMQLDQPALTIQTEIAQEIPQLSEESTLALYRILQQALYNIERHANARHVWVRLWHDREQLVLEVEDDGQGFTVPEHLIDLARRRHLGIVGMSERAEAIGGQMEIKSAPGQGTLVRVTAPLPKP
ncbi:MAG: PAS domain-containing protein [Caldilineaceae bacterium]|nr:PAS domain-containing protein [Caldilineaceae bacterium]